jgi:TonB family protein
MANHTVLIIDYEPRSIRASTIPLEKHGFVVEVAHDGIAGLKAFEKLKPALVLIEAMLPKKHGFEVCQEIKKSAQGKATPVVITTGVYRGRKYRTQALHIYGCDEYLEKPFTEEQLLETCRRFLGGALPGPSRSGHESSVSPPPGPAPAAKKEVGAEQPKIDDRAERATGTDGHTTPRGSGFGPIEGDATEQEITARLDAILPADMLTQQKVSTAAIAVEPAPATPSIGMAEELGSNDALDLGAFDAPETPHPFEGAAEASADLDNVTAEELAGILEPLEPEAPETRDAEEPSADSRIVEFDSHRERRRRRRKRSKKQRRETSRGPERARTAVERATNAAQPAEILAKATVPPEGRFAVAAESETIGSDLGAAAPGAAPSEEAAPGSTLASDVDSPPNASLVTPPELPVAPVRDALPTPEYVEAKASKAPRWIGVAAVVACGVGAVLFFAFRGGDDPVRSAAPRTERTAGLGAPRPTARYDERGTGGSASPASEDSSARAPLPAPAAVPGAARPLPGVSGAQPPREPTRTAPTAARPVGTPVAPKPNAKVEAKAATAREAPDDSVEGGFTAGDAATSVEEPVPASTAPVLPDALPPDTDASEPVAGAAGSTRPPTLVAGEPEDVRPEPAAASPMPARGDLVDLREADLAPTIVTRASPDYPVAARRLRQEGTVILNVLVDENGKVLEVEVIRGVSDELDAAAERAARSWAYRPAEKDGVAVSVWKPEKVTFKL